ncbi:STAS domain-containing protein [Devosia sp. XJ19-1]|uniref:STAS domain-containing protein n=1 Tax=Devosia ureilytica TaxID=2952754 RepID=A0A9Q4AN05_9HYPH|nr:STAS domain-containing protein [Devosia ureilytica]MCP8882700.1 STAS domain-containing protein [Devosia ureilytica]MCP8886932.1 STAS domain-containing protein [Devosia ureilytica]
MAKQTKQTVALPEVSDLDAIDGIRDQLIDALEDGAVTVEAGAVERVSTNALLLLLSAAETARRHHFDFTIESPSAAMSAAIERLGLSAQFSGMMKL